LNQLSRSDTGAELCCFVPAPAIFNQLGPEREGPALSGLGWMYTAAVVQQEMALFVPRFAKAEERFGAVNIFGFEFGGRHPNVGCRADQVVFRQVDIAFLVATVGAVWLAGKAETVHSGQAYLSLSGRD
jgi:hypothetical protein